MGTAKKRGLSKARIRRWDNALPLQSKCMLFAVPLHTVCSDTATALQRDCNGFAVTLQKVCSDFAAGHQATAYS